MTQKYKTRSGQTLFKPSFQHLEHLAQSDSNEGFCLACGEDAQGVEPDARRYTCDSCGEPRVFGASELVLMGLFYFETEDSQ